MSPDTLWYFAFGANMNSEVFTGRRQMHPTSAEPATLRGYSLVFDHPGIPLLEPAFANVKKDACASVYGVLYHMTQAEMVSLRRMEGGGAYSDLELEVVGLTSGPQTARVFWSPNTGITHLKPSRRYLDLLVAGAKEHGLPDDWIRHLDSLPASQHYPILSPGMRLAMPVLNWLFKRGLATPFNGWKKRQVEKARG